MTKVNDLIKQKVEFSEWIKSDEATTIEGFKLLQEYALKLLRKRSDDFISQQEELLEYDYYDYIALFILKNETELNSKNIIDLSNPESIKKDYSEFDKLFDVETIKKVASTDKNSNLYNAMYSIARYFDKHGTFISAMTFKSSFKRPYSMNIKEDIAYLNFLKKYSDVKYEEEFLDIFKKSNSRYYFAIEQSDFKLSKKDIELLDKLKTSKKEEMINFAFTNAAFDDTVDIKTKVDLFRNYAPTTNKVGKTSKIRFEDANEIREYLDNGITVEELAKAKGINPISIGSFLKKIFESHQLFTDTELKRIIDYYMKHQAVNEIMFGTPAHPYVFRDITIIDRLGQYFVDFLNKKAEEVISLKDANYVDENYDAHFKIFSKYYQADVTGLNDLQQSNFWGNFLQEQQIYTKEQFVDIIDYLSKPALKSLISNQFLRYYRVQENKEEVVELRNYINNIRKLFNL